MSDSHSGDDLPAQEEIMASDEELMHRFSGGDVRAFGKLYARHQSRVYGFCRNLTGDAAAAQDLVQESFLRVLRYGAGFDSRSRFSTWLFRVTRNVCNDYLTSQNKEADRLSRYADEAGTTVSHQNDADSRLAVVIEALHRLSPAHREVLVLSRFEGMKYADIAELLEITVDAVKQRAHRALRELRENVIDLEMGP